MSDTILFVDDEPAVLDGIRRLIRKEYKCAFATSGQQAIEMLDADSSIAVVCSDMRMPGIDGATLLAQVQKRHPDVMRLMLTGNMDQGTAVEAINRGRIFTFLNKPVHHERLISAIEQARKVRHAMRAEKDLLKRTLGGAVRTLVEVLSHGFPRIFNRSLELRDLARKYGPAMGASGWKLDMAAMLGQIGWTTVPTELFERGISGAPLSDAERTLVRQVPLIGARLIGHIPRLEGVAEVIRNLQRGYDGSGYPEDGPAGDMLPVEARILRLLTDAIFISGGQPISLSTVAKLRKRSGVYDPAMLDALARACAPGIATTAPPLPVSELSDPALLIAGDRLVAHLRFAHGETVLETGTVITPLLIEKLTNLRLLRPFAMPIRVARQSVAAEAAA
jgi:response regulator RpfG family c-di-GMP phosphodiesterase